MLPTLHTTFHRLLSASIKEGICFCDRASEGVASSRECCFMQQVGGDNVHYVCRFCIGKNRFERESDFLELEESLKEDLKEVAIRLSVPNELMFVRETSIGNEVELFIRKWSAVVLLGVITKRGGEGGVDHHWNDLQGLKNHFGQIISRSIEDNCLLSSVLSFIMSYSG